MKRRLVFMKRMNGLELVENLNKVSEEIEAIFNSYKGEELSDVDSKVTKEKNLVM